jgi:hypothetical protein
MKMRRAVKPCAGSVKWRQRLLKLRTTTGKFACSISTQTTLAKCVIEEQRSRIAKINDGIWQVTVSAQPAPPQSKLREAARKAERLAVLGDQFEITFMGGVREDPDEFKASVGLSAPDYRNWRGVLLQGVVRLQVRLKTDGSLVVEKVLEGEPALVEAATSAIQQWRATPGQFSGKKVDVISTVTFNFQLR